MNDFQFAPALRQAVWSAVFIGAGAFPFAVHAEQGCAQGTGANIGSLIDQIEALPEGGWVRVNENRYEEVWTPKELRPSSGPLLSTPSKIIQAWSSFAWDCRRGDLLIYGGGHANYSGNDTYRWRATTRRWERMSLPSDIRVDGMGNTTAIDGPFAAPPAAHTYDNNIYLPFIDRLLVVGGSAWTNGGAFEMATGPDSERKTGPYTFDLSKADGSKVGGTTGSHVQAAGPFPEIVGGMMWQNRDLYTLFPISTLPENYTSGSTAYAGTVGADVVLLTARQGFSTSQHLFRYELTDPDDPSTDKVTKIGRFSGGVTGRGAGAFDPDLNVYVRTAIGSTKAVFYFWDLAKAGPTNPNVLFDPVDATGQWKMDRGYGMDFDPIRGQYLLWGGTGDVWTLRAPATPTASGWTIERAPLPSTLDAPSSTYDGVSLESGGGVLGKWKYIPELDAFMGLQDTSAGNVWIYKPVGWVRPGTAAPPSVTVTVSPNRIFGGDSVTIAWRSKGASTCSASGDWSGAKQTKGSLSIGPVLHSATYVLQCQGPGGTTSRSVSVLVDPIGPPTIGAIGIDNCVNATEAATIVAIRGTGKPGATVHASVSTLTRTATVDSQGNWQISLSSAEIAGIPDGTVSVTAKQTADSANFSPLATAIFNKDSIAPSATTSVPQLLASSDTGASSSDSVTRDATPTFTGQSTAAGVPLNLFVDGTLVSSVKTTSTGKWTATSKTLVGGPHVVTAAIADNCGNTGTSSAQSSVLIDITKPALSLATIAGDNRANQAEVQLPLAVQGTAESQATVALTVSNGSTQLIKRDAGSTGTWSMTLLAAELLALPEGSLSFTVVATDKAGNTATIKRTVVKDTQIATPSLSPVTGDDVLTPAERSAGISVTGAGEPRATVTLAINSWTRQKTVASDGTWAMDVPGSALTPLSTGSIQFAVEARDVAGNVSVAGGRSVHVASSN